MQITTNVIDEFSLVLSIHSLFHHPMKVTSPGATVKLWTKAVPRVRLQLLSLHQLLQFLPGVFFISSKR